MIFINKISSNETVDFAAQELKKYLRMMMPEDGDVKICFEPSAKNGFRLGLMQDFELDVSDVSDTELDDIIYIDTDADGGIVAGDNPRSVLMAVYELLRQNGCRWLFPGVDGEYIPLKKLEAVKYRHVPSCRYRGPCIEGGCSQQILFETLDFIPKVGMNLFQMQFFIPTPFFRNYYNHNGNPTRAAESLTDETMLQWKAACESEMSKRGIQFHDVGHGWTVAPFGVSASSGWDPVGDIELTEDAKKYLALSDGKRALSKGIALNTQFCMSSSEARKKVAEYVADYAAAHTNVDYLHIWLGDGKNNHCECERCAERSVSDWYVILLNDIDRELSARALPNRIVFIAYTETIWAPVSERIANPDRFTLMIAPITRSYTCTLTGRDVSTVPFVRNKIGRIQDLDEYMAYYREWRKVWKGACFGFEYHFWKHQAADPSGMLLARRIFEDVECYKKMGVDGLIACGSQRSYFPTGFAYYVFARKQYDISLSFEEILKDYFVTAFGEDWEKFVSYFYEVADAFGQKYLECEESADPTISALYNPKRAEKLKAFAASANNARVLIKEHYNSSDRIKTASVRLFEEHVNYASRLAEVLALRASGDREGAIKAYDEFHAYMCQREIYLERYYPFQTAAWFLASIIKYAK